jgi:2-methylcitrate dehydratase PrpD
VRNFDFEPVEAEGENTTSPAHVSGTTVPTALTVADSRGSSGKELLIALCLGDDVACRLQVASGFDFDAGFDNTGTVNKFGAVTIAGRLMGLNEKQIFDAYGIVLDQIAGTMGGVWDKTTCFKLPIALSARDGIFAAELAASGFHGIKDPITGKQGFLAVYCKNHKTESITKDLGHKFYADCNIKPYPCCRGNHTAIDTALKIVAQPGYNADNIVEIELNTSPMVPKLFVGMPWIIGETPQIDAAFSIRYTVADALLRKSVVPEHFSDEAVRDPRITNLVDRMKLPATLAPNGPVAIEIKIKMKDGKVYSAQNGPTKGDIKKNPLTHDEILAKYRHNVAYSNTILKANSEKVIEMVSNLETLKDVRQLSALLIK